MSAGRSGRIARVAGWIGCGALTVLAASATYIALVVIGR